MLTVGSIGQGLLNYQKNSPGNSVIGPADVSMTSSMEVCPIRTQIRRIGANEDDWLGVLAIERCEEPFGGSAAPKWSPEQAPASLHGGPRRSTANSPTSTNWSEWKAWGDRVAHHKRVGMLRVARGCSTASETCSQHGGRSWRRPRNSPDSELHSTRNSTRRTRKTRRTSEAAQHGAAWSELATRGGGPTG